jgi:trehalose 6-phosphate phosphatase
LIETLTQEVVGKIRRGERVWLFLDYDGTLADFAPTPEDIFPDPELIDLLGRVAQHPNIRIAIISGRRLSHIQKLLPLPGVILAGTYGIELQFVNEGVTSLVEYAGIRPHLDRLKTRWEKLIAGKQGFFLEDKGWALAIHARFADDLEAGQVLPAARNLVLEDGIPDHFRILGGHKFLEFGPVLANKGKTVAYLLEQLPWPGALLVYVGDDDKDEEAFEVVKLKGGWAVVVSHIPRPTLADYRLKNPQAVRRWLNSITTLITV